MGDSAGRVGRAADGIEGEDRHLAALLAEEAVIEEIGLGQRQADAAARGATADIGEFVPADRGVQRDAGHLRAIGIVEKHRPGHLRIVPFGGARHREEAMHVELEQTGRRRGEILLGLFASGRHGEALVEGERAVVLLAEEEEMLRPGTARRLADIDEGVEVGRERGRHLGGDTLGDAARHVRNRGGIGRDGLRRQRRGGDGIGRRHRFRHRQRDDARRERRRARIGDENLHQPDWFVRVCPNGRGGCNRRGMGAIAERHRGAHGGHQDRGKRRQSPQASDFFGPG